MDGATDEISSVDRRTLRKWKLAFDQAFRDDTSEFSSWVSSYTGKPIPAAEMEDWLDGTIRRILSSRPRSILEIGCGTGAIANRLIPHVDRYCGVDLSPSAVEQLTEAFSGSAVADRFVCCAAHEVAQHFGQKFDAIVFNSVIQYFPDPDYLQRVLAASISLTKPGGSIFIGDVRNGDLKPTLIASVALSSAAADASQQDVRAEVDRLGELDRELTPSPHAFHAPGATFPRLSNVRTLLKYGRFENELTRFRYDVLLTLDTAPTEAETDRYSWAAFDESLETLERHLRRFPDRGLSITNVRNARLAGSLIAQRQIATPSSDWTVEELREAVAHPSHPGHQPHAFEALGRRLGREVAVSWSRHSLDAFDVGFAESR